MTLRIINDTHIGAIRSAGTTPVTQLKLREFILSEFTRLLPDSDLMVLGDLFDKENIPISDVLKTYLIFRAWLTKGHKLFLVAGNHDLSKTSSTMSSFDFLGKLLSADYGSQVTVIHKGQMTPYGYVIPHMPNQAMFDIELDKAEGNGTLFLHCNYDNHFAAQSDQSLNLSKERADALAHKQIVIAHEHHYRTVGRITLPGNQIASSVSDWLSPHDKGFLELSAGGLLGYHVFRKKDDDFCVWDINGEGKVPDRNFIRIVGTCSADQAGEVVTKISKIRQQSPALVITNAVDIQGEDKAEEFAANLEKAASFDVWSSLKGILTPTQVEKLEKLHAQ